MGGISLVQLNYRDSKPIYEQIKDGFRKLILSESMTTNEKLPSVRELASKLAINPNTIQKAYHELESEGYIYSVAGKGSFVAERDEVFDVRKEELFREFTETVEELLLLDVQKKELIQKIEEAGKGGNAF